MDTSHLHEYPRPDFQRAGLTWSSLNRQWDFVFDDNDVGLEQLWQKHGLPHRVVVTPSHHDNSSAFQTTQKIAAQPEKLSINNVHDQSKADKVYKKQQINVPFVFQTTASGINNHDAHEVVWYERNIPDIRGENIHQHHDRLLLRFGAVDYEATLWLDGEYIGSHRGGHVPFDVDITDAIEGKPFARVTIRVRDSPYDLTQPRGKQYWAAKPESIFYTPSTGIWQSVWLESVPSTRMAESSYGTVLRSDDIESGELHAEVALLGRRTGQECYVEVEASIAGVAVNKSEKVRVAREQRSAQVDLDLRFASDMVPESLSLANPLSDSTCWRNGLALWSPEHPLFYDLIIRLYGNSDELLDEIHTGTGMRSLNWTTGDGTFRLNGQPYFHAVSSLPDLVFSPASLAPGASPPEIHPRICVAKSFGCYRVAITTYIACLFPTFLFFS